MRNALTSYVNPEGAVCEISVAACAVYHGEGTCKNNLGAGLVDAVVAQLTAKD